MTGLNVIDSSGWIEYFGGTSRGALFATAIKDTSNLLVPAISIYEVFKWVRRERGETEALQVAYAMKLGRVISLDAFTAIEAARYPLPLADSIIYATAILNGATLWTQDAHFASLPDVRYFAKV